MEGIFQRRCRGGHQKFLVAKQFAISLSKCDGMKKSVISMMASLLELRTADPN